ncbi:helix-turn-helix domain-containing protein [Hymenobacter rigui]|uniref:AraC family transcriptional regulator n=1 Tax=Hymenobacter rigui TaxID=334424 RepID=A0A428KBN4_9BACT|nr:helix-turn-helix domain-containing protein [Hymenobacter rigui]RSK43886.1 AraC family transcriptional regulator [Hymenobacter rigui]
MTETNPRLPASVLAHHQQRLLAKALSNPMTDAHAFPLRASPFPSNDVEVMTMHEARCGMANFDRRDLFKVVLVVEGANELYYTTRSYVVDRPALVFTNRLIPYAWEVTPGFHEQQGYLCCFSESFLHSAMRGVSLKDTVLYKVEGNPVYYLNAEQVRYFTDAFTRMRRDLESDYAHKEDLLRNQLSIIIHEAARLQPASAQHAPVNAAERITSLFLNLLEVQFPITAQLREPVLKSASDYADRMAIHVNHLNAMVKEVTGKSTTAHINERLVTEAKLLLAHTDWTVAEIAYSLGFGYPTYFNSFFKKQTGTTPLTFRRAHVSVG